MRAAALDESRITVSEQTLFRDGEPIAIRSGEAHYWRLEREAWEPVLDRLVELRATAVTVYVP